MTGATVQYLKEQLHFKYCDDEQYFSHLLYNGKNIRCFIPKTQTAGKCNVFSGLTASESIYTQLFSPEKTVLSKNVILAYPEQYCSPKQKQELISNLINIDKIENIYIITTDLIILQSMYQGLCRFVDDSTGEYIFTPITFKTFGGNLYDILNGINGATNHIRIPNNTYNYIEQLIKQVEAGEYNADDIPNIKKQIDIIGDEVISYRLNKALNNS